jgi:hypothetical protein
MRSINFLITVHSCSRRPGRASAACGHSLHNAAPGNRSAQHRHDSHTPDMAAIAASRDHPGHHSRQLVRDYRQNDYAHHDGRELPYIPGIAGLLDELLQEGRTHA